MNVTEALRILHSTPHAAPEFSVLLACGFTPLHLQTLLGAHLQRTLPARRVTMTTGLFGDLVGSLRPAAGESPHAVAIALEWADLDPRLDLREAHFWGPSRSDDVVATTAAALRRLESAISALPAHTRVAVCLPTLLLPPLFHAPGWRHAEHELEIDAHLAAFARDIARHDGVRLVNPRRLEQLSPASQRHDVRSHLQLGLPYSIAHADAVAELLAHCLLPCSPRKGLITDLDDTLWHGIVGEIGASAVSWDLSSHQMAHGLYQTMLNALAEEGVLLAIASKNSPEIAAAALARPDLRLAVGNVHPLEIHWQRKSESVRRILGAWNIGAESVVFVDDSPLELAEVKAAFPAIECLQFPRNDPGAAIALLHRLRDLFGRDRVSDEDRLRAQSIRNSGQFSAEIAGAGDNAQDFLASLDAHITIELDPDPSDARILELVNKTNQFNLNGNRFLDAEWHALAARHGSWLAVVSYRDKFGPLGKIAVMQGILVAGELTVESWVMSCRAFARQIEFRCLEFLFSHFDTPAVHFAFAETARNGPLRDFLANLCVSHSGSQSSLTREQFARACPRLYHDLTINRGPGHG